MRSPVNRHRLWQVAVDAALIAAAWVLSWYIRFDGDWPRYYDRYLEWDVVVLVVGIMLPVFIAFGFYNRWWRYVSTQDMWGVLRGVVVAASPRSSSSRHSTSTRRRFRAASGLSTSCSCSPSRWVSACWRGR